MTVPTPEELAARAKAEAESKEKEGRELVQERDRLKLENTALRSIVVNREIEAHGTKSGGGAGSGAGAGQGSGSGSGQGAGGAGAAPKGKERWFKWPWELFKKQEPPPSK